MQEFFDNIISGIGLNDILDIAVVAFVIYKVMGFIKKSRAEQLIKGLLVVVLVAGVSEVLNLNTLNWIVKSGLTIGILALVVIFQPELRRGLASLGRSNIIKSTFAQVDNEEAQKLTKEFVKAIQEMADTKTGALIVIERGTALDEICETGTVLDAQITAELIGNIFYEGAPLHDGAVVVRGSRVASAGCVLPLTQNKSLPKELGTRHRAGIGITEQSDAISFMVSEETGIISSAKDGKLTRYLDGKALEKMLLDIYFNKENNDLFSSFKSAIDKIGGSKDASE
ncbi:MAG: diadenylate cyclase CdaA [Eubacterium sp.]|nr:diadenylate cyclase CdaA [Eubacterium sp.]